eukprot:973569-Alexandrium_andersonii.AAC.1
MRLAENQESVLRQNKPVAPAQERGRGRGRKGKGRGANRGQPGAKGKGKNGEGKGRGSGGGGNNTEKEWRVEFLEGERNRGEECPYEHVSEAQRKVAARAFSVDGRLEKKSGNNNNNGNENGKNGGAER